MQRRRASVHSQNGALSSSSYPSGQPNTVESDLGTLHMSLPHQTLTINQIPSSEQHVWSRLKRNQQHLLKRKFASHFAAHCNTSSWPSVFVTVSWFQFAKVVEMLHLVKMFDPSLLLLV